MSRPIIPLLFRKAAPAVTITYGNRIFDTSGGNRSIAVTPAVGDLLLVVVQSTGGITFTVSDNQGGTYYQVLIAAKNASADGLSLFVREQAVASAVSHTITGTVVTSTGSGLAVFRVAGMTSYGAAAIKQAMNQNNQTSIGTPNPTFAAAPLATNPIFGCCYQNAQSTIVQRAGYTEHFDEGYNTPATAWQCMSVDSGETSATIAWGGATGTANWAACAIELNGP